MSFSPRTPRLFVSMLLLAAAGCAHEHVRLKAPLPDQGLNVAGVLIQRAEIFPAQKLPDDYVMDVLFRTSQPIPAVDAAFCSKVGQTMKGALKAEDFKTRTLPILQQQSCEVQVLITHAEVLELENLVRTEGLKLCKPSNDPSDPSNVCAQLLAAWKPN